MFSIKKICAFLGVGGLIPLLCSCSLGIFSDTGTDISIQRDITDYLDFGVMDNTQIEEDGSDTYIIIRGTFTTPGLDSTYNRDFYTTHPIRANVAYGVMTYVSTEISNYDTVVKGTVLALVETKTDPVDLQQARLRLQRLTERYEEEKRNFEKEYEKKWEALKMIWNTYEYKSQVALLERWVLEWQNTCHNYEKEIARQQKTVAQMEAYSEGSLSAIIADRDGMVILPSSTLRNGDTVEDGKLICSIMSLNELIFSASNNNYQTYHYGMNFTWSVNVKGGQPLEMTGSVVTGTEGDLYGNLREDKAFFLLHPVKEDNSSDTETDIDSGAGANIKDATIHGDQETMENVLMVPAKAVIVDNGITYVVIVREDGSLLKKGFRAGGSNANYYWVLDGLEEGAVILAEP